MKMKEYEYLRALVDRIDEDVRKKYMKYSRNKWLSKLLIDKLDLVFEDMEGKGWAGYFRKKGDKGYKIAINSKYLVNNNLNPSMRVSAWQKHLNREITSILIHELTHFYLTFWNDDKLYDTDNSPYFMGYLLFLNPNEVNGYKSFEDFRETQMYKDIKELKTIEEVERYLDYRFYKIEKLQNKYKYIGFEFKNAHEYSKECYEEDDYNENGELIFTHDTVELKVENKNQLVIEELEKYKNDEELLKASILIDGKEVTNETIEEYKNRYDEKIEVFKNEGFDIGTIILPRDLSDIDYIINQAKVLIEDFTSRKYGSDINEQ